MLQVVLEILTGLPPRDDKREDRDIVSTNTKIEMYHNTYLYELQRVVLCTEIYHRLVMLNLYKMNGEIMVWKKS